MIEVTIPEGLRIALRDNSQIYSYKLWLGLRDDLRAWHIIDAETYEEVEPIIPPEWVSDK